MKKPQSKYEQLRIHDSDLLRRLKVWAASNEKTMIEATEEAIRQLIKRKQD